MKIRLSLCIVEYQLLLNKSRKIISLLLSDCRVCTGCHCSVCIAYIVGACVDPKVFVCSQCLHCLH